MSPQRKDTIRNKDSNRIMTQQDPIIPLLLEKYTSGYIPLFNDTHYPNKTDDDLNDSTGNSRTDIDYYFDKLNLTKNKHKYDECKDENSQVLISNKSEINKTEAEEALANRLMSMNFQIMW